MTATTPFVVGGLIAAISPYVSTRIKRTDSAHWNKCARESEKGVPLTHGATQIVDRTLWRIDVVLVSTLTLVPLVGLLLLPGQVSVLWFRIAVVSLFAVGGSGLYNWIDSQAPEEYVRMRLLKRKPNKRPASRAVAGEWTIVPALAVVANLVAAALAFLVEWRC